MSGKLTTKEVKAFIESGSLQRRQNLYLQISKWGTKAWIFRYMIRGQARQMGLGSVDTFTLAEARDRAREARKLVGRWDRPD